MKQAVPLVVLVFTIISSITAQPQRHQIHHQNQRSPISFQAFDQSSRFPVQASHQSHHHPQRSTNIATQLTVNSPQLHLPAHQNKFVAIPQAPPPLFKQSYPGVYVKGLTTGSFKYEPTRQVSHHHGPDFSPRNVASSLQQDFAVNPFSSFN